MDVKHSFDQNIQFYFDELRNGLAKELELARKCRSKRLDPDEIVEIASGSDIAARVEGLIGIKGIQNTIRELESIYTSREELAYHVMEKVLELDINKEKKLEYAVRTAVCILTEGVLVAPTEGISKVTIRENSDKSTYCAVYFSGPIRSAGGTAMALAVLFADIARRKLGISNFRPSETFISRYVEEIELYDTRCARLQYKPPEEDIKTIVRNCPICIDGDPTEEVEVSVHRNLPEISTNRVRSGIALVICEGIAQKAAKLLKIAKKFSLDWDTWLEKIVKISKKDKELSKIELLPNFTYMEEVVAGRVILSFPMAKGGFRLRYGKTRYTGLMSKAIHPATMILTEAFLAFGTQMKIERPGKGCVVTHCDTIHGPVVKLKNGNVIIVENAEHAEAIKEEVEKILFLGDILVTYGDFLKTNHPLVPSGYVEEWYALELKEKGVQIELQEIKDLSYEKARNFSNLYSVPMAPKFTYHWHDLKPTEIIELRDHVSSSSEFSADDKTESHDKILKVNNVGIESRIKKILETLCIPHRYDEETVLVDYDYGLALIESLGLCIENNKIIKSDIGKENKIKDLLSASTLETSDSAISDLSMKLVNLLSQFKIMKKVGLYVGARMGRPEKARYREMKPKVHALFPVGEMNNNRELIDIVDEAKRNKRYYIDVEITNFYCAHCKKNNMFRYCDNCKNECIILYKCKKCNTENDKQLCTSCKSEKDAFSRKKINIVDYYEKVQQNYGAFKIEKVKCVKGLTSKHKIPERLEKGLLRAHYDLSVFKDGTIRFDGVDVPITHFTPKEINVSTKKLKELGYTKDIYGQELKNDDQIIELKVQDIIIPEHAAHYFLKVTKFIDDLLINFYGELAYYNCKTHEDLIGKLFLGLSPHTSAAILCRLIGFTKANCILGHPYFHAAKRRNCDGDEDSIMLLSDALLNFSKHFLPDSRGSTMDAPLVMIDIINPNEIDDEVYCMEVVDMYPLSFYYKTLENPLPGNDKITIVKDILKKNPYSGFCFTHQVLEKKFPTKSAYVTVGDMKKKVDKMLELADKLNSVNKKEVVIKLINTHFFPDLYGNLRKFAKQKFRCSKCNQSFRRVPLKGVCRCGGKLLLTVNRGSIEKYLSISKKLADELNLPTYIKQRIQLIEEDIKSIFEDELKKQESIMEYL
ncbi:MAG: DNA polymerase II large subunit [Candidatus Micrarchaeota archaeon]|nr:DNA polymerase II large subunit [Candidatus Micrarchaeota archaeon]